MSYETNTARNTLNHKMLRNIILFIVFLAVAVSAMFLIPGSAKPITSAADSVNVPENWRLVEETILPPRMICSSVTQPCPSVEREWSTNGNVDARALTTILEKAEATGIRADDNCLPMDGNKIDACTAQGKLGKYIASLTLRADKTVVLNLRQY